MSKTEETKAIENALRNECRHKRIYGCGEVTIGFQKTGHGNEIVDYISMDSSGIFRCYEIKVSESDLKSGAKKSFYGHYNYLVVTDKLYDRIEAEKGWADYKPIPGNPPDMSCVEEGCAFAPRCVFAMQVCVKEDAPLIEIDDTHSAACWKMLQAGKA